MRITLLLVFLSGFSLFAQVLNSPSPLIIQEETPQKAFPLISHCSCGREAHYAGGNKALSAYINHFIRFPRDITWGDIENVRAYVEFYVERDGSLTNIEVIRTNFPDTDESIIRVFEGMTQWIGAEFGCGAARTKVRVPILIKLV